MKPEVAVDAEDRGLQACLRFREVNWDSVVFSPTLSLVLRLPGGERFSELWVWSGVWLRIIRLMLEG